MANLQELNELPNNPAISALMSANQERVDHLTAILTSAKLGYSSPEFISKITGSLDEALFQKKLFSIWYPKEMEVTNV